MSRRRAQDAAIEYLLNCAGSMPAKSGARLPSTATLAAMAGVSHRTMWTVSKRLVAEGVLRSRRGDGLYVAAAPAPPRPSGGSSPDTGAIRQTIWEQTRDSLRADIYRGTYRAGDVLPSVKVLCATYAVSYGTVAKVLSSLVDESLLQRRGRRFRVRAYAQPGTRHRIALVTRRYPEEAQGRVPPRYLEDLALFEAECRRLDLQISPVRISYLEHTLRIDQDRDGVFASPNPGFTVLGLVVWPLASGPAFADFWGRVVAMGKPVSVMASHGRSLAGFICPPGSAVSLFRTARDHDAGVAIGHHLLARGHTRVAFLCDRPNMSWVEDRLAGMRSVFVAAGHPQAVRAFYGSPSGHRPARRGQRIETVERIRSAVAGLADRRRDPVVQGALRELEMHAHTALDSALRKDEALPQCVAACEWGTATAYVGVSDELALTCLGYLQSRGVTMDAVSVAGFDNTHQAMLSGLTTYDFGVASAVHRSLDSLLRPYSKRRSKPGMHEEWVEGQLVDRGSVKQRN